MPSPVDLTRIPSTRRTKRSMLIVHSGGLVAEYLHYLKRRLDHGQLSLVEVDPSASLDDQLAEATRLARRARMQGSAFDEVWCVTESPPSECNTAGDSTRVRVVDFGPCVERWLLLHFEQVESDADPTEISERLALHLPELGDRPRSSLALLDGRYFEARHRELAHDGSLAKPYDLVDSLIDSLKAFRGSGEPEFRP